MSNEDRRDAQGRGTSSGPSYHRNLSRAQGLALAGGRVAPAAEDAFRGSLWEAGGPAADLMVSLGTVRRALLTGPGVPMKAHVETVVASAEQEAIALGDGFVGSWHVSLRSWSASRTRWPDWPSGWLVKQPGKVLRRGVGRPAVVRIPGSDSSGRLADLTSFRILHGSSSRARW